MNHRYLATLLPTTLFVLLWSSGAIFSRVGLNHGSAFAILLFRFILAFMLLCGICLHRKRFLPPKDAIRPALTAGLLMVGGYTIFYLLAMENGITPGVLATILGVQPILTLWLVERNFNFQRLLGLFIAFIGLVLVVIQSILISKISVLGIFFSILALACITLGSILQKKIKATPLEVLPLQYTISIVLCLLIVPFRPFYMDWSLGFIIPVLWLAIIISVVAQLLLYKLISKGNLVNVTSLFYLIPGVTAIMDYLYLDNKLPLLSIVGMGAILLGLALVFRVKK